MCLRRGPANTLSKAQSWRQDLNPQPVDYKSTALPVELRQRRGIPRKMQDFKLSTSLIFVKSRCRIFRLIYPESSALSQFWAKIASRIRRPPLSSSPPCLSYPGTCDMAPGIKRNGCRAHPSYRVCILLMQAWNRHSWRPSIRGPACHSAPAMIRSAAEIEVGRRIPIIAAAIHRLSFRNPGTPGCPESVFRVSGFESQVFLLQHHHLPRF